MEKNNMTQQTAMQELLQWVRATLPMDLDLSILIEEKIKSLLPMEKEQIIYAHLTGLIHPLETEATKQAEQYYNETFGK